MPQSFLLQHAQAASSRSIPALATALAWHLFIDTVPVKRAPSLFSLFNDEFSPGSSSSLHSFLCICLFGTTAEQFFVSSKTESEERPRSSVQYYAQMRQQTYDHYGV